MKVKFKKIAYRRIVRISEVSRLSGVPATTLRFYESIGLVTAQRGHNGYRNYDETVLDRLDLIEASKELGLPLADIAQHLRTLDTRSCTEVRGALRPLLAERIRQLKEKRARLEQLHNRLADAEDRLAACPDRAERCASECALAREAPPPICGTSYEESTEYFDCLPLGRAGSGPCTTPPSFDIPDCH